MKWIEIYRGYDEHHFSELCALLNQEGIKNKTQITQPDSRMAAMATVGSRYGSFWIEKEADRAEQSEKLYLIRVPEEDFPIVHELEKELSGEF